MRIRIRLITFLMRIRIPSFYNLFDADPNFYLMLIPDPNPNIHPDTDPDPSFQIKDQTLENVLK
jgi:hypothetical protein